MGMLKLILQCLGLSQRSFAGIYGYLYGFVFWIDPRAYIQESIYGWLVNDIYFNYFITFFIFSIYFYFFQYYNRYIRLLERVTMEDKMNKRIDCKQDIWDASYRLIEHKDGTISVKYPVTIETTQNSFNLSYKKIKIVSANRIKEIKKFFERIELADDYGTTINDYLFN